MAKKKKFEVTEEIETEETEKVDEVESLEVTPDQAGLRKFHKFKGEK